MFHHIRAELGCIHILLLLFCTLHILCGRLIEAKYKRWNEHVNPYETKNNTDGHPKSARQLRTNLWFRDGNQFRSTYDYRHYGPRSVVRERQPTNYGPNVQMDTWTTGQEEDHHNPSRGALFWAPQGHSRTNREENRWDYIRELRNLESQRSLRMTARTEPPPTAMSYIREDRYPQRMVWNEEGQFWGYGSRNRDLVNDEGHDTGDLMAPYDSDRAQLDTDDCIPPFCIPIDCGDSGPEDSKCRKNRFTVTCSETSCDPRCPSSVPCLQNDFVGCSAGTYGPQCRVLNASRCWQEFAVQCAFGCTTPNDTEAPLRCVCNPWSTEPSHNQTCVPIELEVFQCPRGCSARGRCDPQTRQCQCHAGYTGPACERELIVCPSGLTGPGCKQDIDECLSGESGCEQRCLNEFGSFRCACYDGYQVDAQNPKRCVWVGDTCKQYCVAGQGDCNATNHCVCRPGYEGSWCERDIDECTRGMHKCDHICVNTPGSYECQCHAGYTTSRENPHWCTPIGCEPPCVPSQGTCGPDRQCQCKPGFTGIDCGLDVDECATGLHQCEHQCINIHGSYQCACYFGYKPLLNDPNRCGVDACDPNCTEPVGSCQGRVCQNGGVCQTSVDGQTQCICPQGYEGTICERDKDECAQNPCEQLCYNTPGSFVCACQPGFQIQPDNRTCIKDPIDFCAGGCLNGGLCEAGSRCKCPPGFEGERCETERNPCHYQKECEQLCIPNRVSYSDCCAGGTKI